MEGPMPQQITRSQTFGPLELKCLETAFDLAWRQLRSEEIAKGNIEEIELIRTTLAKSIIACAPAREHDVEELMENGLMGFRWAREFSVD